MKKNEIKKLKPKTLRKVYWRWMFGNLSSMSFEWLASFGFADSMVPALEELYEDEEEVIKALERNSTFYNTEPQAGAVVNGIICGLEEQRASGYEIDDDVINGLKVGLMGPIAGIGDAMIPGMLIPLLLSIGMGLSSNGSLLGPIFYVLSYIPIILFLSYRLFMRGYNLGTGAVDDLVGEKSGFIRESFNMLGAIVVGGVAASYVNLAITWAIPTGAGDEVIQINEVLNDIFPNILSLSAVLFVWWLLAKKNVSPIKTMGILVIISIVGVAIGAF